MRVIRNALVAVALVCAPIDETICRAAEWGGLFAQAPPGGAVIVESGRSFILEGVVVAALFCLALFAVCRSSRRS